MAKRKARKVKNVDPLTQAKIESISILLNAFKAEATNFENYMNSICAERCCKIEKLYMDRLKMYPENIRNMTIAEVMEMQQKEKVRETECPRNENAFRMQHERTKLTSERKRTQRKEKKRSISVPVSARNNPNMSHLTRTGSELSLLTPAKQRRPSTIITPKFDPKRPVFGARKPKPGEVVMSLSGSPLQIVMNDLPSDKPAITLSFGEGKFLNLGNAAKIDSDKEFLKSIDETTKNAIQNAMQKLDQILKNSEA
uniref:Borealin C-terminal domain-containing protein n=1 Tax=Parasteatoda tepidariorum TaxID=114398 RepID=A0A2L2Y9U2_PARTP